VLVILHSGQTGVERGAYRAAVAGGLTVAGFMPLDRRDELGPIPPDCAASLTPCFDRGPRPAVRANVALASGVLVVVPDRAAPEKFTAIGAVIQAIRSRHLDWLACDADANLEEIAAWATRLPSTSGSRRLLVTGPRATRWSDGEAVAKRIVNAIAYANQEGADISVR
jgi:hypothetical protein